jgi:exopolysaccharide biosynthesis polyprenyl glycosylphosphotransferase
MPSRAGPATARVFTGVVSRCTFGPSNSDPVIAQGTRQGTPSMKSDFALGLVKALDFAIFMAAFITVAAPIAPHAVLSLLVSDAGASGAVLIAQSASFRELMSTEITLRAVALTCAFLVYLQVVFSALGLYSIDRVGCNSLRDFVDFLAAALLGSMGIWVGSVLLGISQASTIRFNREFLIACGIVLVVRITINAIVRRAALAPAARRHVVIVGTNRRAVELGRRINASPTSGLELVGFVDQHWSGNEAFRRSGFKMVSDFAGFQDYLKEHVVDEVFIVTPLKSLYDKSARIFAQCEQQGITVHFRSDPVSPNIGRSRVDKVEGHPVMTVRSTSIRHVSLWVKRQVDFAGSAALLLLLSPMLVAIAIAIKLTSEGPVFFTQERIGLNKRRFMLYKFRTMVVDAEKMLASLEKMNEVSGPVFKIKRDPRITSIGRFLRKSSLDELPQLINVLKGEMSLVGPRPLAMRDYRGITEDWQRRRLSVVPGMTGLWQVMGRSSIPFDRWMELDLEYIDNWSLMQDLKICVKTIPAVMRGTGAS